MGGDPRAHHDAKVLLRVEVTGDLWHGDHDTAVEVVHAVSSGRRLMIELAR